MKQELSPAAQAVFESYKAASDGCYLGGEWMQDEPGQIAAALRAAADQVVPADDLYARSCCEFIGESARAALLAIADELEAK